MNETQNIQDLSTHELQEWLADQYVLMMLTMHADGETLWQLAQEMGNHLELRDEVLEVYLERLQMEVRDGE